MIYLLLFAHEHACETNLARAQVLEAELDAGRVPDLDAMESRLDKPAEVEVPEVPVHIPPSKPIRRLGCPIAAAGGAA